VYELKVPSEDSYSKSTTCDFLLMVNQSVNQSSFESGKSPYTNTNTHTHTHACTKIITIAALLTVCKMLSRMRLKIAIFAHCILIVDKENSTVNNQISIPPTVFKAPVRSDPVGVL